MAECAKLRRMLDLKNDELMRLQLQQKVSVNNNPADSEQGQQEQRRPFRILVLDGGGMRGMITAGILKRLEEASPGFIDNVDMIAGTSTGSLLTVFLARKGAKPNVLLDMYREYGPKIFAKPKLSKSFTNMKGLRACMFSSHPIRTALVAHNFEGLRLNQLEKRVLISAFDCDGDTELDDKHQSWSAKFFHNLNGEGKEEVIDCVLASCAAPTYFPLYKGYCDGGVVCNSPVMPAVAQAMDPRYGGRRLEDIVVLNVGTGDVNEKLEKRPDAEMGIVEWVLPLIRILFEGQNETTAFQARAMLGNRFHRISPKLQSHKQPGAWDASVANMDRMAALSFGMEEEFDAALEFVKEQWMKGGPSEREASQSGLSAAMDAAGKVAAAGARTASKVVEDTATVVEHAVEHGLEHAASFVVPREGLKM